MIVLSDLNSLAECILQFGRDGCSPNFVGLLARVRVGRDHLF